MRIVYLKRHQCYFCGEPAGAIISPEAEDTTTTTPKLKLCTKCACDLKDILNLKTDEINIQDGG